MFDLIYFIIIGVKVYDWAIWPSIHINSDMIKSLGHMT